MMATSFRDAMQVLINRHSVESGSDTPDWILALYLSACLDAFDAAVRQRDSWHHFSPFASHATAVQPSSGSGDPVSKEDSK